MPKKSKRILLDLDLETHARLEKIARSHAARLKPYAEKILKEYKE